MFTFGRTLAAVALVVAIGVGLSESRTGAAEGAKAPSELANVQALVYPGNLPGFFDRSTGRLYLYQSDFKTPFMTVEIQKLGDPLKIIKGPAGQ